MARRGRPVFPVGLIFIGLLGIFELIERPRYQAYHAVDVLQLVASGMCFGAALVLIIARYRKSPAA
ncbi:MAG TPA: hypothetical protein VHX36_01905 [Candidatus Acidoferrales bacterium]|nr:hypothetical protein [Candidatus Acidoferrales bacterium]